ncbi:FecR domain-containing protein [Dyadobacter sp. LHD-138]|uniref:FecR domain-containing protein n=1 Tax=Dyadobacter sp. LHD-138 TaxID=3071413 RepID=UPI0027E1E365|nr:FecR domain-containing protein [Dyadobacter sp. LHD-138]MDQ6477460.1 FecR domain-containing protein [Dyadobacter sp. LHD-138]
MDQLPDELFQDLLNNPAFIAWVLEENPELDQYWKNWAARDCSRKEALQQARFTLLSSNNETHRITDEHIAYKISQSLEIAKRRENILNKNNHSQNLNALRAGWMAAASVIVLMAIGLVFYKYDNSKSLFTENQRQFSQNNEIVEVLNSSEEARYVQLPDGSSVVLQKNSRISYTRQFGPNNRVVILSGEAFFEVTKDAGRPFFVYANELVTKVLGTSFSIKADESGGNVLVAVKTGKVSVFSNSDKHADDYKNSSKLSALLLTPNQQASFERSKLLLTRTLAKGSALLKIPIENQSFIYQETPISEVFASLEKAYGIDITFNEQVMAHCSITATLGDEPLENKLKWICTILEATYEVSDNKITITGKACQ